MTNNTREKLREQVSDTLAKGIGLYITPGAPFDDAVDAVLDLIRDNITLEWRDTACTGDLVDGFRLGQSSGRGAGKYFADQAYEDGSWVVRHSVFGEMRPKHDSEEAAKSAALEHYRNTIMSEIGG